MQTGFFAIALAMAAPAGATVVDTSAGPMTLEQVATGLQEPWGLAFLPDGGFLITEREGVLKYFPAPLAEPIAVSGLPQVEVDGQGGLLDVMLPRDFATTREIWLTYAVRQGRGAGTAVGKGRLSQDGQLLEEVVQLFEMPAGSRGGRHFGARLVEAADGSIFVTIGDRGTGPDGFDAQDPQRAEGKVIHLNRDGSPATELPGALAGVYSAGHRNPQGAALDLDGKLLIHEHGARGGDEVNAPELGKNYGWPIVTHGRNYNGLPIGVGPEREGLEPPLHYWDPSIAPSGLVVYSGRLVEDWRGDIFFGSLNSDFLGRLDPDIPSETGFAEERIASPETGRVRDVREAPDGSIWFLSVTNGAAYRLAP